MLFRSIPLAVTITDYFGEDVYYNMITPRGKVLNYRTINHGITEKDVIDQMDEYDNRRIVNDILTGAVVVGHNLSEQLLSLRVRLDILYGLRDLSNGKVFHLTGDKRASGRFALKMLALKYENIILNHKPGRFAWREYLNAIRRVYLSRLPNWVDHVNPDEIAVTNVSN